MKWKIPEYSKSQVIKAGKALRDLTPGDEGYPDALSIVDNWRAAHAFPLQVLYCNLNRKFGDHIVAQRLKRLKSIVGKLQREKTMSLWEMQDLGGCRIIVSDLDEVAQVVKKIKESSMRHYLKREYDYISRPKSSGYRSYHLAYRYHSDRKEEYNKNMLIEIQVRTTLQHLWATAVEVMGNVMNESFKSGDGEKDVLRFLSLISALFARMEGTPPIPGCPEKHEDVISELKSLDAQHSYLRLFDSVNRATLISNNQSFPRDGYVVLQRSPSNKLRLHIFKPSQISDATEILQKYEQEDANDAVLVRVASLKQLSVAYPNYYMDVSMFISKLSEIIG